MKYMFALSCEDRAVIARDVTVRTTSIKRNATDSTYIIIGDIPFPYSDCIDSFDLDLHSLTRLTTVSTECATLVSLD
jgi:hypothetical protein